MRIESEEFKLSHSRFFRIMLMRKGKPYILALSTLLLVGAVGAILLGPEYAVLCLIIIFICCPMAAAWLYYSEGLRPENVVNILPHTLTFHPREILASVSPSEPSPKPVIYRFRIPPGTRYHVLSDGVLLPVSLGEKASRKPCGILWIPLSAFRTAEEMKEALRLIR